MLGLRAPQLSLHNIGHSFSWVIPYLLPTKGPPVRVPLVWSCDSQRPGLATDFCDHSQITSSQPWFPYIQKQEVNQLTFQDLFWKH